MNRTKIRTILDQGEEKLVAAKKRCARVPSAEVGPRGSAIAAGLEKAMYEGRTVGNAGSGAARRVGSRGRRYAGAEVRTKRALIVDDHDLFRPVLALLLGWHTDLKESLQAESLEEARKALDESGGNIDLAIVDFDLPNGEALEFARDLRATSPGVPLLGITADAQPRDQTARELEDTADQVLTTAASSQEIIAAAKQLRSGSRNRDEQR